MHDDQMMDGLLKDTLAAETPRLPDGFDRRVLQRVRPLRLTSRGRTVLLIYGIAGAGMTAWLLQGVPALLTAGGLVIGAAVAAGVSAYLRRLTD